MASTAVVAGCFDPPVRVGDTPLVRLESLSHDDDDDNKDGNRDFYAKLEGHNPFGSIKDRAAFWMIKDGEERGMLTRARAS